MADEFCVPPPPPADMKSKACTWAVAHAATAVGREHLPRYLHHGMDSDDYQNWFCLVGKPFLFADELREAQRGMWYSVDWAKVR